MRLTVAHSGKGKLSRRRLHCRLYPRLLSCLLLCLCSSCRRSLEFRSDPSQSLRQDPAIQFTEAVNAVEPLIDSQLEDLTETTVVERTSSQSQGIQLPPVEPLKVSGNIILASVSELHSLNEQLYQRFVQEGYAGEIDLEDLADARAIALFCQEKRIDILTLSRAMGAAEIEACEASGRQPLAFAIGEDALILVVNRLDTFIKKVSLSQLTDLFTVDKWSQIDSAWPNEPIKRRLLGPESTALNLLVEKAFDNDASIVLNAPNTQFFKYDEPLIQDLSTTRYAVGLLSYTAYRRSPQSFRVVSLEGVVASSETVKSEAYPLGRKLYLYTDAARLKQQNHISAFINFYLTHVGEEIEKVDLFPLTPSELSDVKKQWLRVMELE